MRAIIGSFPKPVVSYMVVRMMEDNAHPVSSMRSFSCHSKPAFRPKGMSKEQLTNEMFAKLQNEIPRSSSSISHTAPSQTTFRKPSGVKGENSIKLFGDLTLEA